MSRKSKQQKNLAFLVLGVIIIGIVGFIILEDTQEAQAEGQQRINLLSPNSFLGETSSNAPTNITCDIKQVVFSIDSKGITTQTDTSRTVSGSPIFGTLSITDSSNDKLAGHVPSLQIRCDVPTDQETIVIERSTISNVIWAEDSDGSIVSIQTTQKQTNQVTISNENSGYVKLADFSLFHSDLENKLNDSSFNSELQSVMGGILHLSYRDCSACSFSIPIGSEDIRATVPFKVEKAQTNISQDTRDTDLDGIVDVFDGCPTTQETYNGFEDGDGCPDSPPTTTGTPTSSPTETTPTKSSCNLENKTWVNELTTSLDHCAGKITLANNIFCKEWDVATNSCIDPNLGTSDPLADSFTEQILAGKVDTNIEMTILDNGRTVTLQKLSSELQPATTGLVELSLSGGLDNSAQGDVNTIKLTPYFDLEDSATARTMKPISSNIMIEPTVRINGIDIDLTPRPITGVVSILGSDQFGGKINGFALGSLSFNGEEFFNQAKSQGGLTEGQTETIQITFDITGSFVVDQNGVQKTVTLQQNDVILDDLQVIFPVETITGGGTTGTIDCSNIPNFIDDGNGGCKEIDPNDAGVSVCQFEPDNLTQAFCDETFRIQFCGGANISTNCEKPEVDSDGDSIPDSQDRCVNDKETYNGFQDTDGCPDTEPEPTPTCDRIVNGVCIINPTPTPNNPFTGLPVTGLVCTTDANGQTVCPTGNPLTDPTMLTIIAVGILVVGIIVVIIRRR